MSLTALMTSYSGRMDSEFGDEGGRNRVVSLHFRARIEGPTSFDEAAIGRIGVAAGSSGRSCNSSDRTTADAAHYCGAAGGVPGLIGASGLG